jgi:hypothetical protein
VANSGNAQLVFLHYIAVNHAKHFIGNSEGIGNFARNLKLNVMVSICHMNFSLGIGSENMTDILEGHIAEISKADLEFVGSIIEAERVRLQEASAFPHIFQTVNQKLVVIMLDFTVCPPTKTLMVADKFDFCPHSYPEPFLTRWDQLRKNMDTLDHPTVVFCVRMQRGEINMPIFRVVPVTLDEGPGELELYRGVGCSC